MRDGSLLKRFNRFGTSFEGSLGSHPISMGSLTLEALDVDGVYVNRVFMHRGRIACVCGRSW